MRFKRKVCKKGQEGKPSQERASYRASSAAPSRTPLYVTGLTEEVIVQRVAALVCRLHRQENAAVLTAITVFVEIPSHALDFEGVLPVSGDDGSLTDAAHRGKLPVEVCHAVHLVLAVQREALVADAAGTGHAGEAGWVEGLAQGPDDLLLDHFPTLAALLQGVLVARLAQGAPILLVESLPSQLAAAGTTGEALGVVLPLHGLDSQLSRGHGLVTETTDICGRFSLWKSDRLFWGRRKLLFRGSDVTRRRLDRRSL